MTTRLHHNHSRTISTALLVVMILCILQLCMISTAFGSMPIHEYGESADHGLQHNCCTALEAPEVEISCIDCEDDQPVMKASVPDHPKPLFSLLYIALQLTLPPDQKATAWVKNTESGLLAARPDIYLANTSFLE